MKKLSKEATKTFLKIMELLGESQDLKLDNGGAGIMPLVVEKVGEGIETPYGIAKLISFAHYYEQNGDQMRDPEIVFLFVDNRTPEHNIPDMVGIYPQMYVQDNLGIDRTLIDISTGKTTTYNPSMQSDSASFCTEWFRNIVMQQKIYGKAK